MSIPKFQFAIIALTALAAMAGLNPAMTSAQEGPASYKIGVVVMPELLEGYQERKAKYDNLETKVKELQAPIDALSDRITKMKERYDSGAQSMSIEDRLNLETEIKNEYAVYQSELKMSQQKIDNLEEQVLKEVLGDIRRTIDAVAEREGYHLILNGGGGPRGSVLYFHNSVNITPKILAELNKGSK